MFETPEPSRTAANRLLSALSNEELLRLLPNLEPVSFAFGELVYESSESRRCAYFPSTCIISLIYTTLDGSSVEVGVVGNDGLVGFPLFLGGESSLNRAVVQLAGAALKM